MNIQTQPQPKKKPSLWSKIGNGILKGVAVAVAVITSGTGARED